MRASRVIRPSALIPIAFVLASFLAGPNVAHAEPTGKGLIGILTNAEDFVPGGFLDLSYSTAAGTLQGPVDLYMSFLVPWGSLLFLDEHGAFVTGYEPFRRNVTQPDARASLLSSPVSLDVPFGTYTAFMGLVYAGTNPTDTRNWASAIASVELSYGPLSPAQTSLIAARGRPDLLAVSWLPESSQKRETWIYLSGEATKFVFLNGNLTSQSATAPGGTGPRIDPGVLSPQTTLDSLIANLGPPTSVASLEDAPEFQAVSYAFGLEVLLRHGRLTSAWTFQP